MEEPHIELLRRMIEEQYLDHPTGCGGSFGELLCYELHVRGLTFAWLADKWGLSLATLGELIWDHCKRLEPLPNVNHAYSKDGTDHVSTGCGRTSETSTAGAGDQKQAP